MDNTSLKNFYKRFPNEEACLVYLEQLRWPKQRLCPHCGSAKTYKYSDGKLFKCGSCKKQFTTTVGTAFAKSHIPLQEWFLAVFLETSQPKGITSVKLAEYLEVTQKTAWSMLRRVRYGLGQSGNAERVGKQIVGQPDMYTMFAHSMRKLATDLSSQQAGSLPSDVHR